MAGKAIPLVAAALALSTTAQTALAQATTKPSATRADVRRTPPRRTMNVELTAPPPNFPIPMPAGSKFIMGYEAKYEKTRPTTFIRLHHSNNANALREWYWKGLTGLGWKVTDNTPHGRHMMSQLFATRPDQTCLIQLNPAAGNAENGTDILVTFGHK